MTQAASIILILQDNAIVAVCVYITSINSVHWHTCAISSQILFWYKQGFIYDDNQGILTVFLFLIPVTEYIKLVDWIINRQMDCSLFLITVNTHFI